MTRKPISGNVLGHKTKQLNSFLMFSFIFSAVPLLCFWEMFTLKAVWCSISGEVLFCEVRETHYAGGKA
jgi:hypothetical protein